MKQSITPRAVLVIIASMFLIPLLLAWLMYTGTLDFRPESTRNKGTLVVPPVPLDWQLAEALPDSESVADQLLDHWVVLYPLERNCDSGFKESLASLRQIHLASGRHRSRIRLAVLLNSTALVNEAETIHSIYDKFTVVVDTSNNLTSTVQTISQNATKRYSTYLIDPLGNIMMAYAADADPNDLKQDLKRLLTWSKLDEQQ